MCKKNKKKSFNFYFGYFKVFTPALTLPKKFTTRTIVFLLLKFFAVLSYVLNWVGCVFRVWVALNKDSNFFFLSLDDALWGKFDVNTCCVSQTLLMREV